MRTRAWSHCIGDYSNMSLQPPSWSLIINDTEPTFFYCSGPRACTQFGMVAVINPVSMPPRSVSSVKADMSRMHLFRSKIRKTWL